MIRDRQHGPVIEINRIQVNTIPVIRDYDFYNNGKAALCTFCYLLAYISRRTLIIGNEKKLKSQENIV